jgi:hypothetical protein
VHTHGDSYHTSTMTDHDDDYSGGGFHWDDLSLPLIALILTMVRVYLSKRFMLKSYQRSYAAGLAGSVSEVARAVRSDRTEASLVEPASGVYDCVMKEHQIVDRKTADIICGGAVTESTMTLIFTLDIDTNGGMSIKGRRSSNRTNGGFYTIEEGFVASSGMAYWVERSREQSILVSGNFRGNFFEGEWLTSDATRGRYTKFTLRDKVEADLAVPFGAEESVSMVPYHSAE